jgi:hypothetical protein
MKTLLIGCYHRHAFKNDADIQYSDRSQHDENTHYLCFDFITCRLLATADEKPVAAD